MLHLELEDRLGYTKQDPVMKKGRRKPNKLSLVKFSHNIKGCPNYLSDGGGSSVLSAAFIG